MHLIAEFPKITNKILIEKKSPLIGNNTNMELSQSYLLDPPTKYFSQTEANEEDWLLRGFQVLKARQLRLLYDTKLRLEYSQQNGLLSKLLRYVY